MEVTIGVQHLPREITVETDQTSDEVVAALKKALAGEPTFEVTDTRGRHVVIATSAIGYVEIGTEEQRRVGFGSL